MVKAKPTPERYMGSDKLQQPAPNTNIYVCGDMRVLNACPSPRYSNVSTAADFDFGAHFNAKSQSNSWTDSPLSSIVRGLDNPKNIIWPIRFHHILL